MENRKDTPALNMLLHLREINLEHKEKELKRMEDEIFVAGHTSIMLNPVPAFTLDGATIINATLKNCKISNCKIV